VGKALIQKAFMKAAMLYIANPSPHEHPDSRRTRREFEETQDVHTALKMYPKQLRYERLMLKHLSLKPRDYVGAFKRLPDRLLKLFPQAYQAYLFNNFVSRRMKEKVSPSRVEVGDWVLTMDRSGLPIQKLHHRISLNEVGDVNRSVLKGKAMLAFPLIGYKRKLSGGYQGEIEKTVLEEEDIEPESFRLEEFPEISMRGSLRTALTIPKTFSAGEIRVDQPHSSKHNVSLAFTLTRGSYATTLLREIMKPRNPVKAGY
jgi:tRNA pseudouridine13 synthase